MMFPHACGAEFAEAISKGADPQKVIPNDFVVVRGGGGALDPPGTTFSGATAPTVEAAAAAVPHGQIRVATVGAIRANGGTVEWVPELSRHGTPNRQHVDVTEIGQTGFSGLQPNPVPRQQRIDGDKN